MQRTIEDFLRALRSMDLRISTAEAIDAHRVMAAVGYADRALARDALCVTLAKTAADVDRFETCFDVFFSRTEFTTRAADTVARNSAGDEEGPRRDPASSLADLLMANDSAGLAQAMEAAAAGARAGEIQLNAQRGLIARRLLDGMGLRDLEARIGALRETGAEADQAIANRLAEGRQTLFAEAGRFVERHARLRTPATARRLRESILTQQALTSVDPEDFRAMESLVKRMAKRLASRYARKRRHARRGQLDVRRTVSRAMAHGGVPFDVVWKCRTIQKPKIAVLCDVSRSVASAAQFLLLFLYSLNEVVERLDAYAFSDHAVGVNDLLNDETVDDAIALILGRIGLRPTDYGAALADFRDLQGQKLDRRTTVIVLGDGRSNYSDPRLDLMRQIRVRARSVIWLNPEPQTYWAQGDSRMHDYRRFCSIARTCNTLRQLERLMEEVLRAYLPR